MGTTLSNLYVFIDGSSSETEYRKVLSIVEEAMHEQGFETVTPANGERFIRIVFDPNSSWISVYHPDLLQKLRSMPNKLSQIGHSVIEIDIFDSDVLQMRLFRAGQLIDTYSDWDNYDEYPRKSIGNAEIWANTLSVIPSSTELEGAWKHQNEDIPFESEGTLYRVMDLLGLDKRRLYIDDTFEEEAITTTQVTDLHFRYGKLLPYDVKASGKPAFSLSSLRFSARLQMEKRFSLSFSVKNLGGQSHGVTIEAMGEAVDKNLVEPIGLVTASPFDVWSGKITNFPETHKDEDGTTIYQFNLNSYSISQGLADWNAIYDLPDHLRDFTRESKLQRKIMFAVILKPIQTGKGQITIRITPSANPDGFDEFSCDVEVVSS